MRRATFAGFMAATWLATYGWSQTVSGIEQSGLTNGSSGFWNHHPFAFLDYARGGIPNLLGMWSA